MTNKRKIMAILAALPLLAGTAAIAQDFDIDWYTVDGGGGTSSGGTFELSGTCGQPDAGEMAGGAFTLTGGFWFGAECVLTGDLDADGDVDLTDLATLLSNYGMTSGATYEDGDIDGDGDVDLTDLAGLLSHYGETC